MRPVALLTLSVSVALASCATSTPSVEWRDNQRARLSRMHEQRSLEDILADVIARTPNADEAAPIEIDAAPIARLQPKPPQGPGNEQNPTHIDQRLPQRPGFGPRSFGQRWQPLETRLDYGIGDVMARSGGTRLNDRTDAVFARARIDAGSGVAMHAQWWQSDDGLFGGQFLNDGIVPQVANAELGGVDLFPHLRFDNASGDWSMPIRFGMFANWQHLDHQQARIEREWLSFGPRILIEPQWTMLRGDKGSLNLFARFGGDVGVAWFSEEFRNGDDKDVIPRWAGQIGAGLRGDYGAWHAELGYRIHHATYGQTQGDLLGSPNRTELQRQQVFFGLGYTY